jgi:hypothetical protein
MDIGTVIEIVSMLEQGKTSILKGNEYPWGSGEMPEELMLLGPNDVGAYDALHTLSEHLQAYIESKLNSIEAGE